MRRVARFIGWLTLALGIGLVLAGCAEDQLDDLPWTFEELMDTDPEGVVDVQTLGEIRLQPHGPVVADAGGTGAFPVTYDVLDAGERLAVRVPAENLEVVLWLDRQDAATYTVQETQGLAEPGVEDALGGSSVTVSGTEPVTWLAEGEGGTLVSIERRSIEVQAWFPHDDIDQVRVGERGYASPRYEESDHLSEAWVLTPSDLHSGPEGLWFGQLLDIGVVPEEGQPGPMSHVRVRGAEVDGYTPIVFWSEGVRVDGWVRSDRVVHDGPHSLYGFGSGGWGRSRCGGYATPVLVLPEGGVLYDDIEGEVVAHAVRDQRFTEYRLGPQMGDGWRSVEVGTEWGYVELWMAPGDGVELVRL